jgi:mRNA interferase MazF
MLIISNIYENLLDVVTVIPITSLKKGRRFYPNKLLIGNELELPSLLLYQQIRTISKHRLVKHLTTFNDPSLKENIVNVLCIQFNEVK